MTLTNENIVSLIVFVIFMFAFTLFVKWYIKHAERSMLINAVPEVRSYPILVQVRKAEYVEKIIGGSKNLEKSYGYDLLTPWLGEGLILSKGSKWHRRRKIITPTFHYGILGSFCDVFSKKSKILIDKLEIHCGTGEPFDICKYITRVTLDIICESAMGTTIHAQEANDNEYVEAIYTVSRLFVKRLYEELWLHPNIIFKLTNDGKEYEKCLKVLHSYTKDVVESRKTNRKGNKKSLGKSKRLAFLDLLLEEQEKSNDDELTIEDICEEVDSFMFGGHDTTTAAISWNLFLVGLHPQVQKNIFKEIQAIFQDSDRNATLNDLNDMKYLDRVIKEALRLYPPVPKVGRLLSEDIQLDEYKIPTGCMIGVEIYYLHRDERFFPDPEKFQRFHGRQI